MLREGPALQCVTKFVSFCRIAQAWASVVRRVGAAQQPDRAAPHAGVPEIGATLSGCCADAGESAQGQFEYRKLCINWCLTDGAGQIVRARGIYMKYWPLAHVKYALLALQFIANPFVCWMNVDGLLETHCRSSRFRFACSRPGTRLYRPAVGFVDTISPKWAPPMASSGRSFSFSDAVVDLTKKSAAVIQR